MACMRGVPNLAAVRRTRCLVLRSSHTGFDLLVDSLEMVDFDTFDSDETRDNQKELDRGRKLQQSGHVLHASLVVTRGKVTNFGGAAAVHFSFQAIPSQQTQPLYLVDLMFTKTLSSAPATATEQATAQAAAAARPPAVAIGAASTEQPWARQQLELSKLLRKRARWPARGS